MYSMSLQHAFNNQSWEDKVLEADLIWAQVKAILQDHKTSLPETPRRPDVRMIIDNITGMETRFANPGNHAGSKEEVIPATGEKCAVMVMIQGDTLEAQNTNAKILYDRYDLGNEGLSEKFVNDLRQGVLGDLVAEAYGPAPFLSQAEKLVPVVWEKEDGGQVSLHPEHGVAAAYGTRAATAEKVFLAKFHIYVKGTGTIAELVESTGMNIAVAEDWNTKTETTRPIVPSVAKTYYGACFDGIPSVIVHPDGMVKEVNLGNGQTLKPLPPSPPAPSVTPKL